MDERLAAIRAEIQAFIEAKVEEIEDIEMNEDASDDQADKACDLRFALQLAEGAL